MADIPEHALTSRGGSFDVVIPAGATAGSIVLHPDKILEMREWHAVSWQDLPDGQAGDHVPFRLRITRLVKPGTVWPVWESDAEDGDAYQSERHVFPSDSPITVTVELLHGPRDLPTIVRQHVIPPAE